MKPALTNEGYAAVVCIRGRWQFAEVNEPADAPDAEHALVTSGDVLRSGHYDSLGEALGFTREDVEDERQAYHDAVVLARHYENSGMEREHQACRARAARHLARADRIEALLPPEER